jgi:hypothetical protein
MSNRVAESLILEAHPSQVGVEQYFVVADGILAPVAAWQANLYRLAYEQARRSLHQSWYGRFYPSTN